jgi:hypothetical protein
MYLLALETTEKRTGKDRKDVGCGLIIEKMRRYYVLKQLNARNGGMNISFGNFVRSS